MATKLPVPATPPSGEQIYKTADFVRGFFAFLASEGIRHAVLHGGKDGFERNLSDVDFAVEKDAYAKLPEIIANYCHRVEWQLCQVLRHETTAAYFVCSAANDPSCAVALDACSDYQRNGTLLLGAEELLAGAVKLPWGGYGLSAEVECRYRFVKAAAKGKEAGDCAREFGSYNPEVRENCQTWLESAWGVHLEAWDAESLAISLHQLRSRIRTRRPVFQKGSWKRFWNRVKFPTGLIVVTGSEVADAASDHLRAIFGHLYFRRSTEMAGFGAAGLKGLVSSTIMIVPHMPEAWRRLVRADCIYGCQPGMPIELIVSDISRLLHQRCLAREGIGSVG